MPNCDACDGLRINGRLIVKDEYGWKHATNADIDAPGIAVIRACRDCARERLDSSSTEEPISA